MSELFDIRKFDEYKEDNRREVKKAREGLPVSLWESYSSFANCEGGIILLGVIEKKDGSWKTTGLKKKDEGKLLKEFWDLIHNEQKVNRCIIQERHVKVYDYEDDIVIAIEVPKAERELKPIFINGNIFQGTFRRDHEGDYHCTKEQVRAMLRDQTESTIDMKVLDDYTIEDINKETFYGYRNRHRTLKIGHPFERLDDEDYLKRIGAAAISKNDGKLHLTVAGLLMFGEEYNIVREFPEYFLDYREMLDPTIRWTDRLQSSSGEWSGNLCDFYFRVYNKIIKDLKVPFKTQGGDRIDDTPVHKAIREALANCLINTDYYGSRGIVIKKETDKIVIENPGYIRIGKKQMRLGGESDPRNKTLMKMFNMINIGERAGSGVPDIFNIWEDEGWIEPEIVERFKPDRTILSLEFKKKQAKKTSDKKQAKKTSDKKQAKKTSDNIMKIRKFLKENGETKTNDIAKYLVLSPARTRVILNSMDDVEFIGSNSNRRYKLKE